jgi:hypothetical protein
MKRQLSICLASIAVLLSPALARGASDARALVDKLLQADPFGLAGAEVVARLTLSAKRGARRELVFSSISKRYDPPYAKSLVRFSAPADLAGAAFLQIQKRDGDDDRYLYLPELKRSRRIAGGARATAFMGTDFSYADLDQRDFRDSRVVSKDTEQIAKWPCDVIDITPSSDASQYSHIEIWMRQDNALPMRMRMYDRSRVLLKTFEALEFKRVSGRWFISRSRITDAQTGHSTELALERIAIANDVADEQFSVRALEKS